MTADRQPPPDSALEPEADAAPETDLRLYQMRAALLGIVRDRGMHVLTLRDLAVLLLAVAGAPQLTVRGLAHRLLVSRSSISRVLTTLHRHQLARRIADPDDRRSVLVEATELGRDLAQRAGEAASSIRSEGDVAMLHTLRRPVAPPLSGEACITARKMLAWSMFELAEASGVSESAIRRLEEGESRPRHDTLFALRTTLEAAGVEFTEENDSGSGVRLRKGTSYAGGDSSLRPSR